MIVCRQTLGRSLPSGIGNIDWSANGKLWPALMAAGFGMMASRSPFPGVAIGEGGQAGLQTYAAQRGEETQTRLKQAQIDLEAKKLAQSLDMQQKHLDLQTRPYSEMTASQKAELEIKRKAEEANEKYRQGLLSRDRYRYEPGTGYDPATGEQVPGTYRFPTQAGAGDDIEPKFYPGKTITRGVTRTMTPIEIDREARMRAGQEVGLRPKPDDISFMGKPDAYARAVAEYGKNFNDAVIRHQNELRSRYGIQATGGSTPQAAPPTTGGQPAAGPPPAAGAAPLPPGIPPGSVYGKDRRSGREGYRTPDGRFLVTAGPPPS